MNDYQVVALGCFILSASENSRGRSLGAWLFVALACFMLTFSSPAHANNRHVGSYTALASYYGAGERLPSRYTANGEVFHPLALTAASRTLPMGTLIEVCFRRCAPVRINDRGPAAWTGRSLDLSLGAARAVGLTGVARVRVALR